MPQAGYFVVTETYQAAYRTWAKSAINAAGVTPGTRCAAAKLAGRARERRSCISRLSPDFGIIKVIREDEIRLSFQLFDLTRLSPQIAGITRLCLQVVPDAAGGAIQHTMAR